MAQLFANNAEGELSSSILASATALPLGAGEGASFPSPSGGDYFLATIFVYGASGEQDHEIVKCNARTGDTLTVERAQEGTTALDWAAGSFVQLRITKGTLELLQAAINAKESADPDILKADTPDVLNAGFAGAIHANGTLSTGTLTLDEANGNLQSAANGGPHTLAPPVKNTTIVLKYTNTASAGAITTSGFTVVEGDAFTTTEGDGFICYVTKIDTYSLLTVKAMQ